MEIIVHKHFDLSSPDDVHDQYRTPVWEIEIQSPVLDTPEFEAELHNNDNFGVSEGHCNNLRSIYNGSGVISKFLKESNQDFLLDLVSQSRCFKSRFYKSVDEYCNSTRWFATVLRDQPEFNMNPHLDNSHIMIQMIVNLKQDNETATEFYQFNKSTPVYQAPLKKNHGVVFLNTPGSVHSIVNPNKTRWIFYGGVAI
jgi:hypothetical protein